MLLRYMNRPQFCIDTCLVIKHILDKVYEATILTRNGTREFVFIAQFLCIPTDCVFPMQSDRIPHSIRAVLCYKLDKFLLLYSRRIDKNVV